MLRKVTMGIVGSALFLVPMFVSASALGDLMDHTRFTLSRIAASRVDYDLSKPSCVVLASAQTVRVGEKYLFAWGASGTFDTEFAKNTWAPSGAYIIAIDTPGTRVYTLEFYGAQGVKTTCTTRVIVR